MEVDKRAVKMLRWFERLKEDRAVFEETWKEAEFNVAPITMKWENEKPKDAYQVPKRETNRPTYFLNTCITGILGYAMAPNINWFKLSLQDQRMNEADGVPQWLELCERMVRRTFERCGLYQQGQRWLYEAGIYGHGVMLIEEMQNADAPLRYHVPVAQELYLDNNEIGETAVVFRSYWSNLDAVIQHYGRKAMHEKALKRFDDYNERTGNSEMIGSSGADMSIKLLHAVYVRRTGKPTAEESVANKKWASMIIDVENKHIIRETGYDDFPYAVFFWEKIGKAYGISPAIRASNDIAIFQSAMSSELKYLQKAGDPSISLWTRHKGKENFAPGGITYLDPGDQAPVPLQLGSYQDAIQVIEYLEKNIKDPFYVDFFLMLRNMGGLKDMTATAVNALQAEQAALLSSLVANLFEGLSKIVSRTFDILAKKQLLPPMPFALQQNGGSLKTDFIGVLAQAQKAAYEYNGLQNVMAIAGQYANFAKLEPRFAKVLNWIKEDELFKQTVESMGAPKAILRTQEEYDKVIAGIDEQEEARAAQAQQDMQNQAVMQNAQNLNQRVAPGSVLEGLLSQKKTPPERGSKSF